MHTYQMKTSCREHVHGNALGPNAFHAFHLSTELQAPGKTMAAAAAEAVEVMLCPCDSRQIGPVFVFYPIKCIETFALGTMDIDLCPANKTCVFMVSVTCSRKNIKETCHLTCQLGALSLHTWASSTYRPMKPKQLNPIPTKYREERPWMESIAICPSVDLK